MIAQPSFLSHFASSPINWSLEFELLCYCAQTNPNSEQKRYIEQLTEAENIDWNKLIELAFLHQVAPLLYYPLKRYLPKQIPQPILDAFDIYYQKHKSKNELLTQELLEILQALDEKKIIAVPFKGPLIAHQLYGDTALRSFRDLDFLIQEADISSVIEILKIRNYHVHYDLSVKQQKAFWQYAGQDIFHRQDKKISVEPHWAFAPTTLAIDICYAELFQRIERKNLKNVPIYSFTPEDTLIILCIHGSKELWGRLKWICDIAEFINAYPRLHWQTVLTRATQQGCLRMVYLGLLLAHRIFDSPLDKDVKQQLHRDKVTEKLAQRVCMQLASENIKNIDVYQLTTFRWLMRERWRDRRHYYWRTLTTPRARHFRLLKLPDTLSWGYYPIKLAHDYCAQPGWTLLKSVFGKK